MTTIGLIGVGCIGKQFVDDLLEAGYDLTVYDIDDSQIQYAVDRGATAASGPASLTAKVDVVLLALPGSPEVEETMAGEQGILTELEEGTLVVDATTTLPATSIACEEFCELRGAQFVEAPITGGAPRAGKQMMIGGSEEAYEAATNVLDTICDAHVHVGECGRATICKLGLQLRYAGQHALDAEIVTFLEEGGVDARVLPDFFEMDVWEKYYDRDFSQEIEGLGGLAIWNKDVGYALQVAREENVALPMAGVLHEAYKSTARTVDEDEGSAAALITYWERLNGHDR